MAGVIIIAILFTIVPQIMDTDDDIVEKDSSIVQNVSFNVIIDNSASLAGYLSGSTEFKDNTSKLLSFLDKLQNTSFETNSYKATSIYYASGSSFVKEKLNSSAFRDKMRNGIATGGESMIDSTLEKIIDEHAGNDKIAILLTDGIFDDRSADPANKISIMQGKISSVFNKAVKKGLSTVVYQFMSKFNGSYFTADQNVVQINGIRPYFVWVIGGNSALERFVRALESEENFKPENKAYCGLKLSSIHTEVLGFTKFNIATYDTTDGTKVIEFNDTPTHTTPASFVLGLDFRKLPYIFQNDAILNPRLKFDTLYVKFKGLPPKFISKDKYASEIDPNDKSALTRCSHFIEIEFSEVIFNTNEKDGLSYFSLLIKNKKPDWITNASASYDWDAGGLGMSKTFGLDKFIDGVYDAYKDKDDILELKFYLKL